MIGKHLTDWERRDLSKRGKRKIFFVGVARRKFYLVAQLSDAQIDSSHRGLFSLPRYLLSRKTAKRTSVVSGSSSSRTSICTTTARM
ncbi:hypothetical protein CDAR_250681 [Caerostris darwini]|uniref:Uncharacterized protein n=1 Tax=Caerostris darwini TaxID=1538125 RepID=A0AAV4RVR1_9ARAC|nr:hypothetical protein CDAR_250681 [Caerostris darwini]